MISVRQGKKTKQSCVFSLAGAVGDTLGLQGMNKPLRFRQTRLSQEKTTRKPGRIERKKRESQVLMVSMWLNN